MPESSQQILLRLAYKDLCSAAVLLQPKPLKTSDVRKAKMRAIRAIDKLASLEGEMDEL